MRQWIVAVTAAVFTVQAVMSEEIEETTRLPAVTVYGTAEGQGVGEAFLPDVQGTHIYSGKKTAVIDLQSPPQIQNNNYRQALAKTPGLLLSEETSPLLSLGYRGLEPHRAQFTQVLKDGVPIHADMFGYPEAYYTPPLEQVHHMEFLHGGAALAYGPQPGGALNYVTHMPRTDREFSLRTHHTFGSDNFYSTYNALDGTVDRLGYYAYFHHRQGDGFREHNSDFEVNSGSVKLVLDAKTDSRWILNVDAYSEMHGEPGGLNRAGYKADRDAATRLNDRFALERYFASLAWEKDISDSTLLTLKSWGGYYERFSKRQRGGGFGTPPTGAAADSNTIELQEFYTAGVEGRLRHDWDQHTLTAGVMYYHTDSPRTDRRGASADADTGMIRNRSDREIHYAPVFVENRFVFDKLSITPGVRLENIWQSVDERINVDKTANGIPLGDESDYDFVPLFGLGVAYQLPAKSEIYANISQAYRPKIFTQSVPTGGLSLVPRDLDPSKSWQAEIGARGAPTDFFWWDVSAFLLEISDQVGTVTLGGGTNTLANVGRAQHIGIEAAAEFDVTHAIDAELANTIGSFALYGNVMLLDAEFKAGPQNGNTPQYAPDFIVRTGVNYRWRDRVKVSLLGTFVDEHFANDNNTADRFIPSYGVWDLIGEVRVYKQTVSLVAGINNLFDEDYYARIRADGIDPAYRRNYYGGVKILLP